MTAVTEADFPVNAVVVDTDVVSFLLKRDTRGDLYEAHLTNRTLVISFQTLVELERWALERNWGTARRTAMEAVISNYVLQPFDRELCSIWAAAWIAATAILYDISLVTHNAQDYAGLTDLRIITESPRH